ncbi:MAG: hypothetical protein A3B74_00180 [Candidatus Kerfeldbacteria bacterium RIFCSPHIGHO2_02_FULL_42_14]|uniref:Fe/B12 periplasmic-binding domain-containing protein n=1 Tax=Candidatus Kerfeldbacteria bacterium RIFCSPHIGHO2_02_FULL_42_14 TaxID=1798540 RepID=A0A1G2ARW1_9BACT|nr:MAG: hypothetical protein A3B74_00180 [Candidatus Kerfeldbacteria bacterium RIFCSPHIGHO2_02_FULL_42_14]OGY81306.1 MAG: hypothetical protein A3E60_02560 [Candidatus Kerfeldbacteria bacterium RIFCSPHIGHO2_12_FULL_42_13]OGY83580.1 MAG: hypothetical protein A3I91_02990 [Candidatus Kerfeldbacteria bacterium RIFCSPLOWO2_02_FULL_42_19]OGY86706.1 MAG: hypothetical protein A3G01_00635 [Candidatus Kerfeldbacteria bacterium RIFCSPLOWO2_12_FULL_43_9]
MLRVVSLAPSNTEILYALGCQDNIIAVTKLCDYPEAARQKSHIGTWTETDCDALMKVAPDIILTSYYLPEALRQYTGPGEIYHLHPKTLGDVFESIVEIGSLFGKEQQAQSLVANMKQRFASLAECSAGHNRRFSVYAEEWGNPPMIAGNWVPEILKIAGGVTGLREAGQVSCKLDESQLFLYNPEVILIHWCGRAMRSDVAEVQSRPNWRHLRAVRAGHVFRIDDSLLNRPGPRLVEGAQAVHDVLHALLEGEVSTQYEKKSTRVTFSTIR